MTLCLTNPIWVTKTRLVLQYSTDPSQKMYRGMVDALVKIYRQEGVAGLYRVGRGLHQGWKGSTGILTDHNFLKLYFHH